MDLTNILTTTLTSALDIFKYVTEKYGVVSDEVDQLMDVYDTIFPEELSSELQRRVEAYKMEQLATTLNSTHG